MLRHASERYTLDIRCEGRVLEPEIVAPPFTREHRNPGGMPSDGDIFRDRSEGELKSLALHGAA